VLAKADDEIVIHRTEGAVREQVTCTASQNVSDGWTVAHLRPSEVLSVGTRVNRGVMAGARASAWRSASP